MQGNAPDTARRSSWPWLHRRHGCHPRPKVPLPVAQGVPDEKWVGNVADLLSDAGPVGMVAGRDRQHRRLRRASTLRDQFDQKRPACCRTGPKRTGMKIDIALKTGPRKLQGQAVLDAHCPLRPLAAR